jgi:hypothetical protein
MRGDRGAAEMERPVLAALEDRLGRHEVACERQRQRLVVLAVGRERLVLGHRVEAGLGLVEVVAPGGDPAGQEPDEEWVHLRPRVGKRRFGSVEVAVGEVVSENDEDCDRAARRLQHEFLGERQRARDVVLRDARDGRVLHQQEIVGIEGERPAVILGRTRVVVAHVRLGGRKIRPGETGGGRERRRRGQERGEGREYGQDLGADDGQCEALHETLGGGCSTAPKA